MGYNIATRYVTVDAGDSGKGRLMSSPNWFIILVYVTPGNCSWVHCLMKGIVFICKTYTTQVKSDISLRKLCLSFLTKSFLFGNSIVTYVSIPAFPLSESFVNRPFKKPFRRLIANIFNPSLFNAFSGKVTFGFEEASHHFWTFYVRILFYWDVRMSLSISGWEFSTFSFQRFRLHY